MQRNMQQHPTLHKATSDKQDIMKELEFVKVLEKRASLERKLLETEVMPGWAKRLGDWLVVNPWRMLVPIAGIGYLVVRSWLGVGFREWILGLFGG